ncbi:hypothetical protein mvi_52910 [Methylobacterium indicum]|uniref:Uncharacterized protein n=1 Tax=Methylobacterium indicum TaxID=1775910 RepID=A0A8H8WY92_9HYPH|nr:hypothetical protein mvi_52910 [Methylobacterium indicum]
MIESFEGFDSAVVRPALHSADEHGSTVREPLGIALQTPVVPDTAASVAPDGERYSREPVRAEAPARMPLSRDG